MLAELLRPAALAAHAAAAASVFTSGAEARRRAKEGAQRALEELYALLQLYARGLELLQVRVCVYMHAPAVAGPLVDSAAAAAAAPVCMYVLVFSSDVCVTHV